MFAVSEVELKTGRIGAAYEDTRFLSEEGEWFVAGILDGLADGKLILYFKSCCTDLPLVMPMVCFTTLLFKQLSKITQLVPTINGYKRLVTGEAFWAPNAITYGYDSRAASIRIISPPCSTPSGTRLEIRVPGADMNPYYALSAIFSLGLRGIKKKLKLPCPPISECLEDKKNGKVVTHDIPSCEEQSR